MSKAIQKVTEIPMNRSELSHDPRVVTIKQSHFPLMNDGFALVYLVNLTCY